MLIYSITNNINGKAYIGQTVKSLEERWYNHRKSARGRSRLPIHCAIRKYGEQNFNITIVSDACSREQLDAMETYFIARYNTITPNGYNRTIGGAGFNGNHTESSRARMRESHLGKVLPPEQREKIRKAAIVLWQDFEFRKKNKGKLGHKASSESRSRLSASIKKHWETRKRMVVRQGQ